MRRSRFWTLLVAGSALGWSAAAGDEPARAFLDGLRERGYHDVALQYLDQMANSPLAPAELTEVLDLERAITLIQASRSARDSTMRSEQLDQAQGLLKQFIDQHTQHLKVNTARSELGKLIGERARLQTDRAKKGDPRGSLAEARKLYQEAVEVFEAQELHLDAQLEEIPKVLDVTDDAQAKLAERRSQLRADYLQTQLLSAAIREEMADTEAVGSEPYQKLLQEAAEQYESIYKRYRQRLAGLYARMFQGRANQKLGKYRDALGFYVELLDQPDSPDAFRILKAETLRLAMDCWLDESQNKYIEAIRRGTDWLLKARPHEERDPDWLYIRLSVARAYLKQADEAALAQPPNNRVVMNARNEARKHAQIVARYESEFQSEARQIIAQLDGTDPSEREQAPSNFEQAFKAGSLALDAIEPSTRAVNQLQSQIAAAADPQAKAALEQKLADAQQSLQTAHADALRLLRLALQLADLQTPAADVNIVRYLLAYLYYAEQSFYDAAVMAEFVARRYPEADAACQCAKIALACYLQLYTQTASEQNAEQTAQLFKPDRIVSIAEYIVEHWPESSEAEEALATLIPFMINTDQVERAREFLQLLPAKSARRPEAALRTGKAMWQQYLRGVHSLRESQENGVVSTVELAERQNELNGLKEATRRTLIEGAADLPADARLGELHLTALLSLAQAHVETQTPEQALQVLEDPNRGPLSLVRADDAATKVRGFPEETYKTALRAYIASLPTTDDKQATMQNARAIMDEMQKALGATADGQERLIALYVGLARDLEEQLRVADDQTRQALSEGFEAFLTELSASAFELNVLNWVAETFAALGGSFDRGDPLHPQAARYYAQAASAFQNILDKVQLSPQMRTQVHVRLAAVRKNQRQYDEALEIFRQILQASNSTLNVQVEAAQTLQQAGRYEDAMTGAFSDPDSQKNIVWGWGKIAQVTARYKQFQDIFHQARYNLAASRYELAETRQGAERTRLLELAAQDISLTRRLYGLGNDDRKRQYDALLKKIQRSQGQPPRGIE